MNHKPHAAHHKQRRRTTKRLLEFRKMTGKTPKEVAALLGWELDTYKAAEAGLARLSEGQQNDVRRAMGAEMAAATVRDRIRNPKRGGIQILKKPGEK